MWRVNDLRARQGEYSVEEWSDAPDGRHYYESVKFPPTIRRARIAAGLIVARLAPPPAVRQGERSSAPGDWFS